MQENNGQQRSGKNKFLFGNSVDVVVGCGKSGGKSGSNDGTGQIGQVMKQVKNQEREFKGLQKILETHNREPGEVKK
jgi:hypothetical protein